MVEEEEKRSSRTRRPRTFGRCCSSNKHIEEKLLVGVRKFKQAGIPLEILGS